MDLSSTMGGMEAEIVILVGYGGVSIYCAAAVDVGQGSP